MVEAGALKACMALTDQCWDDWVSPLYVSLTTKPMSVGVLMVPKPPRLLLGTRVFQSRVSMALRNTNHSGMSW